MKTSKELFREFIQPLRDAGYTYADIAHELGFESGNLIGMILNPGDKSLLSLDRLPALAKLCNLTPYQVTHFTLARTVDAAGAPLAMSPETLTFVMRSYAREMRDRHWSGGRA